MKKFALLAPAAAFALASCGSSDSASQGAQADSVEMPAEETMTNVDPAATPASDAAAVPGADASASPAADASAAATTDAAAEAATKAAEKKM